MRRVRGCASSRGNALLLRHEHSLPYLHQAGVGFGFRLDSLMLFMGLNVRRWYVGTDKLGQIS